MLTVRPWYRALFHINGSFALVKETERTGWYSQGMAIYLCRWPNGEFSIVNANTKSDAIELLDEWGNAEQASLKRMPDCMFDFRLRDDGEIELADIGGATRDLIMETCYPELDKAISTAEWDDDGSELSSSGQKQIRDATRAAPPEGGTPYPRPRLSSEKCCLHKN